MHSPSPTPINPCGLEGLAFVEFVSPHPQSLAALFHELGFSKVAQHRNAAVELFVQNQICLLVNEQPGSFASDFATAHGPSICGLGFAVADANAAQRIAVERGARPYAFERGQRSLGLPAIYGVGDGLIYFVERPSAWRASEFIDHPAPVLAASRGLSTLDHLTNNVHAGTLARTVDFYKSVFGFTDVRSFDIHGQQTGLRSVALRSPDGSFCVPINEATDDKSQIAEYLREHGGPGVQHLALLTDDLLACLDGLQHGPIRFLDIDADYYEHAFARVPGLREDPARIKAHRVLLDGDEQGYLLQIFTHNVVGPLFFELIQRENHAAFGEGNFGALFRSIERDQARRGVL
jgi:4-hydroxyphenylpyruvate dioxygenase